LCTFLLGKGLVVLQKTITASKKKKALALGKGFLLGILLVALNFGRLLWVLFRSEIFVAIGADFAESLDLYPNRGIVLGFCCVRQFACCFA